MEKMATGMILSELNANTTLATRIKSFSLDQLLWVCQSATQWLPREPSGEDAATLEQLHI